MNTCHSYLIFPQIFRYDHPTADILHEDFFGRLEWRGTPDSDIQTGAVYLHNVTYNDTGTYRCTFYRSFILSQYNDVVVVEKDVELSVVAVGKAACTPENLHPLRAQIKVSSAYRHQKYSAENSHKQHCWTSLEARMFPNVLVSNPRITTEPWCLFKATFSCLIVTRFSVYKRREKVDNF